MSKMLTNVYNVYTVYRKSTNDVYNIYKNIQQEPSTVSGEIYTVPYLEHLHRGCNNAKNTVFSLVNFCPLATAKKIVISTTSELAMGTASASIQNQPVLAVVAMTNE